MIANPLIDAGRTALLGHSEGTWLASGLAHRFPEIRELVLIGAGLGPMHVLNFSQVTLPLLGVAPFDTNNDGALDPGEAPFSDPAALARFQERIRVQGQVFLLRYEGEGQDLRPVGLNKRLDTNGNGKLDLLSEVRPVYEAIFANIAAPLAVIERHADPSIMPVAGPAFEQHETFDGALYASYQDEPLDANLRALLDMPGQPRVLIVNGEHDDQTPRSSAQLLADRLAAAGFPPMIRIYPGLSHVLSPQPDIFAPYGADMAVEPIADIAAWLQETLEGS